MPELLLTIGFHLLGIIFVYLDIQTDSHEGEFAFKGFFNQKRLTYTTSSIKRQKF